MAVTTISLSSVKNYTDDLTKDKFDSLNFVSFDGGELATVSGNSIYNIILGDNDTAGSLTYRISAAENDILELNNKLGDGFSDTSTVTQQFSTAKERITVAEETAQVAASTLDNFLTVADGKDFLFFLDDLTVPVGRLDKLTNGSYMFYKDKNITNWNINLPLLKTVSYMFSECGSLTSFTSELPALTNGYFMFYKCKSIKRFNGALPSLTDGELMFGYSGLESWHIPLPSLKNAHAMFYQCTSLKNFTSSLPELTSFNDAFHGCTSLTRWDVPLPKMTDGYEMLTGCTSLKSFTSPLPMLTTGHKMFYLCKLDLASVQNIADTINDLAAQSKTGIITIGMAADLQGNSELAEALAAIRAKGWTVTEQYNS